MKVKHVRVKYVRKRCVLKANSTTRISSFYVYTNMLPRSLFFQLMSSQVQKQLEVMMRSPLSVSVLLDHDNTSRVESPGVHIAEGCGVTAPCNPFFYSLSHNTHTPTDTITKSFCISFQNFLLVSCLSFLLLFFSFSPPANAVMQPLWLLCIV